MRLLSLFATVIMQWVRCQRKHFPPAQWLWGACPPSCSPPHAMHGIKTSWGWTCPPWSCAGCCPENGRPPSPTLTKAHCLSNSHSPAPPHTLCRRHSQCSGLLWAWLQDTHRYQTLRRLTSLMWNGAVCAYNLQTSSCILSIISRWLIMHNIIQTPYKSLYCFKNNDRKNSLYMFSTGVVF